MLLAPSRRCLRTFLHSSVRLVLSSSFCAALKSVISASAMAAAAHKGCGGCRVWRGNLPPAAAAAAPPP